MKILYSILSLILVFNLQYVLAQMPAISWTKTLGGTGDDIILSTKKTSEGGYILGGVTASKDGNVSGFRGGSSDLWVVKLSGTGSLQWQKALGGGNAEKGTIVSEIQGGYLVGGTTSSGNGDIKNFKGGVSDIWVVKLNSAGAIVWQRSLGGSAEDAITSLRPTPDGGCIVGGVTTSSNGDVTGYHGGKDVWVAKLSALGVLQWQRSLGSSGDETLQDIQLQSDGGVLVLSRIYNVVMGGDITTYHGSADLWVVKLSSAGVLQWQRTLGGSGIENWAALRTTSDGGFIIGTGSNSADGDVIGLGNDFGYWVVKFDASGQIQWQWSDPLSDNLYDIRQTADGGYILAGSGQSGSPSEYGDALFVKLNSAGGIVWKRNYGGSSGEEAYLIQEDASGNFVALATTQSKDLPGFHQISGTQQWPDVWVIKLDANGNKIVDRCYGGSGEDWLRAGTGSMSTLLGNCIASAYIDRCINDDGSIFFGVSTNSKDGDVTGLHTSRNTAKNDMWFVKLQPFSAARGTSVIEAAPLNIHGVYPNPANNLVTISFSPTITSSGRITIFDPKGLLVKSYNIKMVKGQVFKLPVDISTLSAGTYHYRISSSGFNENGQFLKGR